MVDDDHDLRASLVQALQLDGLRVVDFPDGNAAARRITRDFPGMVITDLRMPGLDGTALFARLHDLDPDLPVVVITGHGDVHTAVDLMRRGAYDFLPKPFSTDQLLSTVRRALEKRALALENRTLRAGAGDGHGKELLGTSDIIARVRAALGQIAATDRHVLLLGETGTGKSRCAALLHGMSRRSEQPCITVDCGGLPARDLGVHLFGCVSGAVPGATLPRTGMLRRAGGGTVVLDRIERLPAELQPPILQLLDSDSATPVGGSPPLPIEARIIATADPALTSAVDEGRFSSALFHRLKGVTIELPPLRDRPEDVLPLFGAFVREAARNANVSVPDITHHFSARLRAHRWPGNVRELQSLADEVVLGLGGSPGSTLPQDKGLREAVARFEADYIRSVLSEAGGDVEAARMQLDLPRKTLYDKMARHGLVPAEFRRR
ncbi:sigma-54-dependent transcriptional regulator [Sphingomonas glaciei]|uniref:Sigma-54 dependent transcriptional regulator n=1 Tax=Sphingomonas glaciei TaxID=2938948 RepID=A0ABY5N131_9SPHN|nr:sigma-54 dependent transcriptional regulator [Sphingomonas glaciei]UUR08296.1 sigma-54 dependent transcriptional regulator [Sphingomonas glaciei]